MNIVLAYLISLGCSSISNILILYNVLKDAYLKNLKLSINKKNIKILLKEIILFLIPIINLVRAAQLRINYMTFGDRNIDYLYDLNFFKNMSKNEKQELKDSRFNIIKLLYINLKYKKLADNLENCEQQEEILINYILNEEIELEQDFDILDNKNLEIYNFEDPLKLVRKKKNK